MLKKPAWRDTFIKSLREHPNVTRACIRAGITRDGAYKARERSPLFAKQWDDALTASVDFVEEELFRVATGLRPDVRTPQVTALLAILNAHRSELYKYGQRGESTAQPVTIKVKHVEGRRKPKAE